MGEERKYTSKEVCDILGISIATLNRRREKGVVTPTKKDGRLWYSEDDVMKLLNSPLALLHGRTEEIYYTPKEVCGILGISIATLNRRRAKGEITPEYCGQMMFYPASEIDKCYKKMLQEYEARPESVKKRFSIENTNL